MKTLQVGDWVYTKDMGYGIITNERKSSFSAQVFFIKGCTCYPSKGKLKIIRKMNNNNYINENNK